MQILKTVPETAAPVTLTRKKVTIPTYPPSPADRNPPFFDKRANQLSDGRTYPIPLTDGLADTRVDRDYDAVILENRYLKIMVLPELGGRVQVLTDKTNGAEVVYRNNVVKPALIALAGPWISGGIEFNWPQHHRPTTFHPIDVVTEEHEDGSRTAWVGEIEPLYRMKGMTGITLHPDRNVLEFKIRLYNRTPFPQPFMWWANIGVPAQPRYQIFFPNDIRYVHNHYRSQVNSFPVAKGVYGGFINDDFGRGVDVSFHRNIQTPMSYFAIGSRHDFFGGYDHDRKAGLVYVADHHISPSKKLFTWGHSEFADAWYRGLTDRDGPYLELMAGVYADNQPDFSWIAPFETRAFSWHLYPIRDLGTAQNANREAAGRLEVKDGRAVLSWNTTSVREGASVVVRNGGREILRESASISPQVPWSKEIPLRGRASDLRADLISASGETLLSVPLPSPPAGKKPEPHKPPLAPAEIGSVEELHLNGLHLEQYRHPNRDPEPFYEEALRRDPGHAASHNAMGLRRLRTGRFADAEEHFRAAIRRLSVRNPHPSDGEPFYNLGLALWYQGRPGGATDALYRATWNYAWRSAGHLLLGKIESAAGNRQAALDHARASLAVNADNHDALNLLTAMLRKLGSTREAIETARETLDRDPLDFQARNELVLLGEEPVENLNRLMRGEADAHIELAVQYLSAGLTDEALAVLGRCSGHPIVHYYEGFLLLKRDEAAGRRRFRLAAGVSPDYCFPSRLETIEVLEEAMRFEPKDARAPYYLGNLLFDKGRRAEALRLWERSRRLDPTYSVVHRNLGQAYFHVKRDIRKAVGSLKRAAAADPRDGRLLAELNSLLKFQPVEPEERLRTFRRHLKLVMTREDLTLELAALYNLAGRHEEALKLLTSRQFHAWEGGGIPVGPEYENSRRMLGWKQLRAGRPGEALAEFEAALRYPETLGEGKLKQSPDARIHLDIGLAHKRLGEKGRARAAWKRALARRSFAPENLYFQAEALRKLGRKREARARLGELHTVAGKLLEAEPEHPYFAWGANGAQGFRLDPGRLNERDGRYLKALVLRGRGQGPQSRQELRRVLKIDPAHSGARMVLAGIPEV